MGTLGIFIFLLSIAVVSADSEVQPMRKRFDIEFNKRSVPISGAPEGQDADEEELEYGLIDMDHQENKRFDPFMKKRFDIYKKFDPLSKRFDPYSKRFDPYMKRFDPFVKRFDPFMKKFDPLFKRFSPTEKKSLGRDETVRNLLYTLGQSKRNIIDPRAFNIGFGR